MSVEYNLNDFILPVGCRYIEHTKTFLPNPKLFADDISLSITSLGILRHPILSYLLMTYLSFLCCA